MKVILDTSIWIEFFKGKSEYFEICQQLLDKGQVTTIELIFAELLQGALNKKEVELIKAYFELVPKVEIEQFYILSGEFSKNEKLMSKGIGLIDACIITATIRTKARLWTLDKKIKNYLHPDFLFVC